MLMKKAAIFLILATGLFVLPPGRPSLAYGYYMGIYCSGYWEHYGAGMRCVEAQDAVPYQGFDSTGMPDTPECRTYLDYAKTAGAPETLEPLMQLYRACVASGGAAAE